MEQLKGKIGGINRLGTTSDMILRLALRRLGVDPEKETKIIATGENPQRLAALANNLTQFTLLGEPLVREAEKLGFRDLYDIGTLKIPYHVNAVVTRKRGQGAAPVRRQSRPRLHRSASFHQDQQGRDQNTDR